MKSILGVLVLMAVSGTANAAQWGAVCKILPTAVVVTKSDRLHIKVSCEGNSARRPFEKVVYTDSPMKAQLLIVAKMSEKPVSLDFLDEETEILGVTLLN